MNCSEFLERFSEYLDGTGDETFRTEAEEHLSGCRECSRYERVVRRGTGLLQSFPAPRVSDDFYPRLQHRIYHVEDGDVLKEASGSGATAATALAMAVLLAAAAWSPALRDPSPDVELSPIVVTRPAARPLGLQAPPVSLLPTGARMEGDRLLWDGSHALLYQYSPLSSRGRSESVLRRTGLD